MDSIGSEDFLRMMAQYGLPMPSMNPAPSLATSPFLPQGATPGLLPMNPMATEMPLSAPAAMDAAPEVAEPTGGFAPASFQPPRQIAQPANQDIFGRFMETLGLRTPTPGLTGSAAAPTQRPMLRAQPSAMQGGMGVMGQPRKPPLPQVPPQIAKRFPSSARVAHLLDTARRNKGLI